MPQKLLTFAIPTFNMEDFLEKCVRSCICANMESLELIIVNDGSKDRSSDIGHRLEKEFPGMVRVIDKENGNYGTCVNRALDEATGKYFKMLDPDDRVDTEALNSFLGHIKSADADLLVTVSEDRLNGKELICRMTIPSGINEAQEYNAREFDGIKMGAKYLYCSHCLTYKTEILRNMGLRLQAGISYTDNEFVFYPLDHINTLAFYNLPLYQYYVGRPGSTTVNADIKMQTQMWQVLKGIFDYFYEHYEETPHPVRNNQRILIATMVCWIFQPIFGDLHTGTFTRNPEREAFLSIVQPYLNKDEALQGMVKSYFKQRRFNWYGNYCKTGKLLNYTPIIDLGITMGYCKSNLENVMTSLGRQLKKIGPKSTKKN